MSLVLIAMIAMADALQPVETTLQGCGGDLDRTLVSRAQRVFYNGDYDQTIALTDSACDAADSLPLCEVRTSALLFAIKQKLVQTGNHDNGKPAEHCTSCTPLIARFVADTARGQARARTTLRANPLDQTTRFLLAKLDLNYVWLQLGVLRRKTGWGEYWEARRSIDEVL